VPVTLEASGTAAPYAEATVSTKLMGTVLEVAVREGDKVQKGVALLTIDARELAARSIQAGAAVAQAEAVRREAEVHANRMRTLFAQEAAPRAQLDAAETALARAEAGVHSARAAAAELDAVREYATVRAPFAGVVTRRMVDPGAFATPGAPLLTIQDASRLRIEVTAPPDAVRDLTRGTRVAASVEGTPADAVVEGIVPAGGSLYTVNAILDNREARYLAGSVATLSLPQGERDAILVPELAIHREGDLTGIYVKHQDTVGLRWVRLGRTHQNAVEVLAGLRDGEQFIVPGDLAGVN
jgi:RND family efflux transporter MFP subunit